jgi:hypothetical protein
MFVTHLLTTLTKGIKETFDGNYPEEDFRDLHASIEFPIKSQEYPSVWITFETTTELENVGIGHIEYTTDEDAGEWTQVHRWRFAGLVNYTVAVLTSLERARLADELVKVMAFGTENQYRRRFRDFIEGNPFIAVNFNFDQIALAGWAETPGTPWGTDDIIYEVTVRMEVVGEFVSDGLTGELVPLSQVIMHPYTELEGDPFPLQPGWLP